MQTGWSEMLWPDVPQKVLHSGRRLSHHSGTDTDQCGMQQGGSGKGLKQAKRLGRRVMRKLHK